MEGRHRSDWGERTDETCEVRGASAELVEQGRGSMLEDDTYVHLAELFRVLADSSRVKIVHSLLLQELCTCDLAAIIGISEPAVSQHLRHLRALRLVKSHRHGRKVLHSLDDDHVKLLLAVSLRHLAHETMERPEEAPEFATAASDTGGLSDS